MCGRMKSLLHMWTSSCLPERRQPGSCGRMGVSPMGAIRIGVEVFRPENSIREKIERSANPSGASAREGFFIF